MNDFYAFKTRLQEALDMRGMTAAELAVISGIQKSSLSRYLKGTNIPRGNAIAKMAAALDVTPSWLLGYDSPLKVSINVSKSPIDLTKLTKTNKARLLAYYQALLDSQEDKA